MSQPLPPWIEVERGSAPILLVAPHGGRREDVRVPGKHKVNDLRTADLTRQLAARLDASFVVNARVDRNEVDLNRLSQVRRDAPWLLALLRDFLAEMLARAGRATVLVVHGWNVSQVACDVGVGMREHGDELVACRPGSATVSSDFVRSRLRPLQAAAGRSDIAVTIGSRYPAAHPNNLLQIFATGGDGDADDLASIRSLCHDGVVDAAQLELAIPLRWPGARRERFLDILGGVFGAAAPSPEALGSATALRTRSGRVVSRRGLQLVTDDLLVMASIEGDDAGALGGRVVLSDAADRLALFTGELVAADRTWSVPPLVWYSRSETHAHVAYEGPLVAFPTHTPFLDLERGLADGTLVEARLDLAVEHRPDAAGSERFGSVDGTVVVDGRRHRIATCGLVTHAESPTRSRFPYGRVTLPVGPWGDVLLLPDPDRPWSARDGLLSGGLVASGPVPVRALAEIRFAGTGGTLHLARTHGTAGPPRVDGSLERVIPVRRPGPLGTVVATTFALVRVAGRSVGWLEAGVLIEDPNAKR